MTRNDFLYLLNKIDFDSYLESNDDEKLNCIRRILLEDFEDSNSVKIENILILLEGFVNHFNNINSRLSGYW